MNAENYAKTFSQLQLTNTYLKYFSGGMLVLCVLMGLKTLLTKPVVVIAPSTMGENMLIGSDFASRGFYSAWGLFIATSVGNVNPRNGEFVISQVAPHFHGSVYQEAVDIMSNQIDAIAIDRISYTFEPTGLMFESDKRDLRVENDEVVRVNEYSTDTVYVTGWQVEQGPVGDPVRREMTYEMAFEVFNYTPRILVMKNYQGKPETTKVSEMKKKNELTRERSRRDRTGS